jgi:hypothetical protein
LGKSCKNCANIQSGIWQGEFSEKSGYLARLDYENARLFPDLALVLYKMPKLAATLLRLVLAAKNG